MSWLQKLNETYEKCSSVVGIETDGSRVPLLPICHTTQKAHIEIVIDGSGTFKRSRVVSWPEARTIIPCTEKSGGRTSKPVAHPLCDKLQYVAMDYEKFGGSKDPSFEIYQRELAAWCNSEHAHPKTTSVLQYVRRGRVIRDLIDSGALFDDGSGKLLQKKDFKSNGSSASVFDVVDSQEDVFVRWIVESPGELEPKVWRDQSLWDSWIRYYTHTKSEKTLCYVKGEVSFAADQHPAKLRNDGDKGKLISANDSSGFTYRGRFIDSEQAAGVNFIVTQQAHNALRWLISRQGYRRSDQAIVAWAISGKEVPQPLSDPLEILEITDLSNDDSHSAYTAQEIGIQLRNRMAGYGRALGNTENVVVIGLNSATPGRTAVAFYREMTGAEYLDRIETWHKNCTWLHRYRLVEVHTDSKSKKKPLPFFGAPSPVDIAEAAYGEHLDDKLKVSTVTRLLPCIIDGQPLPRDIVESAVRRASNRGGLEKWSWEKALSIACSLYKKFRMREDYSMALESERNTRDYLYGRLLALADSLEQWAISTTNEDRQTTAARLMNRFSERPFTTWRTIELALQPYKARLGGKSRRLQHTIDEVKAMFATDDFVSDKRLSGEFLLGFSCQREYLRNKLKQTAEPDGDVDPDEDV